MNIQDHILPGIREHAAQVAPNECCGLVIICNGRQRYTPCANTSGDPSNSFRIAPDEFAAAEDLGEVYAVVHSHVNVSPEPSQHDRVECETSGYPWIIVNHPTGQFTTLEPTGYRAPLIGRQFSQGGLDCYQLAKDYYAEVCKLEIPHFDRGYDWWLNGGNLIAENFRQAGFHPIELNELRQHDGLIMQIESKVPNHVAVYIGNNLIMHHVINRLSSREPYGGYWRHVTVQAVRHGSLM